MTLRRILVPVDFSAGSLAAVREAQQIARAASCELHLLHVTDVGRSIETTHAAASAAGTDRRLAAYHRLAAVIAGNDLDPFHTTGIVRRGVPEQMIAQYAGEIRADLIVMGIHGQDQMPPNSPGRVIEGVLGAAHCPVLAIPEHAHDTFVAAMDPERAGMASVA